MSGIEYGLPVRLNAVYDPHRWLARDVLDNGDPNHVSAHTNEDLPHAWRFEEAGGGHVYLALEGHADLYLHYGPLNPEIDACKLYVGPKGDSSKFRYELVHLAGYDFIILEARLGEELDGLFAHARLHWPDRYYEGAAFMDRRIRGSETPHHSDRHFVTRCMFRILDGRRPWAEPGGSGSTIPVDQRVQISAVYNRYIPGWLVHAGQADDTAGVVHTELLQHYWYTRDAGGGRVRFEMASSVKGRGGLGWFLRFEHYPEHDPSLRLRVRNLTSGPDSQCEFRYESVRFAGLTHVVFECGPSGPAWDQRFLHWTDTTVCMDKRERGPLQYPYRDLWFNSRSMFRIEPA